MADHHLFRTHVEHLHVTPSVLCASDSVEIETSYSDILTNITEYHKALRHIRN